MPNFTTEPNAYPVAMKRLSISAASAASLLLSQAAHTLPSPTIVDEISHGNAVTLSWTDGGDATHYHVTIYRMHTAADDECLTLAETDFSHIESAGSMTAHEGRNAEWDFITDCPGWYVRSPLYMRHAIGIDTFNQFPGYDPDDQFGGAYILSPDYDLSKVAPENRKLYVTCRLANEESSVTGALALYTWNDDASAYRISEEGEQTIQPLSNSEFQEYTREFSPSSNAERTRICISGYGYSALWADSFIASIWLKAGDAAGIPAHTAAIEAQPGVNRYTIDTSGNTPGDYIYGYTVRGVRAEPGPISGYYAIRAISPIREIHRIGENNSIDIIPRNRNGMNVVTSGGYITVNGLEPGTIVEIYQPAGQLVATGEAGTPIQASASGILIVRAGSMAAKIAAP